MMWSFKRQESGVRSRESVRSRVSRVFVFCLLTTSYCLLFSACRRDMQDQPKAIAYRENSFYKDGTGSRPLVDGTVPRGYLREDRVFYSGKKATAQASPQTSSTQASTNSQAGLYPDDVDAIPMQITKED